MLDTRDVVNMPQIALCLPQIALYFGFLSFYTNALLSPTLWGLVCGTLQYAWPDSTIADVAVLAYCAQIVVPAAIVPLVACYCAISSMPWCPHRPPAGVGDDFPRELEEATGQASPT